MLHVPHGKCRIQVLYSHNKAEARACFELDSSVWRSCCWIDAKEAFNSSKSFLEMHVALLFCWWLDPRRFFTSFKSSLMMFTASSNVKTHMMNCHRLLTVHQLLLLTVSLLQSQPPQMPEIHASYWSIKLMQLSAISLPFVTVLCKFLACDAPDCHFRRNKFLYGIWHLSAVASRANSVILVKCLSSHVPVVTYVSKSQ